MTNNQLHPGESGELFFEELKKQIQGIEKNAKGSEEMEVIVNLPGDRIWVSNFEFVPPCLMRVEGHDSGGNKVQILGYFSSFPVQVKMKPTPLLASKPRPIGFSKK